MASPNHSENPLHNAVVLTSPHGSTRVAIRPAGTVTPPRRRTVPRVAPDIRAQRIQMLRDLARQRSVDTETTPDSPPCPARRRLPFRRCSGRQLHAAIFGLPIPTPTRPSPPSPEPEAKKPTE